MVDPPWYHFLWVPQEAAGVYQALQDVDGQVRNWLLAAELSLRILDSKQGVGQAGSTIRTESSRAPKDWQVLSLADVGFLLFFGVVLGDYGKPCQVRFLVRFLGFLVCWSVCKPVLIKFSFWYILYTCTPWKTSMVMENPPVIWRCISCAKMVGFSIFRHVNFWAAGDPETRPIFFCGSARKLLEDSEICGAPVSLEYSYNSNCNGKKGSYNQD